MRAIRWQSIEGIRSGKSSPAQVNAISNACGKFLGTIKLEIEYHKLTGKTPNIGAGLVSNQPIHLHGQGGTSNA
jgi:hypothetical protein